MEHNLNPHFLFPVAYEFIPMYVKAIFIKENSLIRLRASCSVFFLIILLLSSENPVCLKSEGFSSPSLKKTLMISKMHHPIAYNKAVYLCNGTVRSETIKLCMSSVRKIILSHTERSWAIWVTFRDNTGFHRLDSHWPWLPDHMSVICSV